MNGVNCGKCGGEMTPENAKVHPELFLHDECLPDELKKPALDPKTCRHDSVSCILNFNRIEDVGRFMADIRIVCEKCHTPFRFVGLPAGMDYNSPCVSVDGCELRAPVAPRGEVLSEIEGTPIGFTVRKTGGGK